MNRTGKKTQAYVFFAILSIGLLITALLVVFKPTAERKPVDDKPPEVTVVKARPTTLRIPVISQGTVKAKIQIKLVAEVAGKIAEISALENSGGYFEKDELLLRIDDSDYQLAIVKARAQVAAASQSLARVEAEAEQARFDLQKMGRIESKTRAYALREPHLKEARAMLKAAQADLSMAELQKRRTSIKAPFNGRVINKLVDVGQYVTPGSVLAEIYAVDSVEIRLPLSQSQLSLIDIPIEYENEPSQATGSGVLLTAEFAGKKWNWPGLLVRTEGLIDASNKLLYAVVEVDRPYQRSQQFPDRPPLTPGLFVRARIEGKQMLDVFVLPRSALRYGQELWLLNEENLLEKRSVNVLFKDEQFIYLHGSLRPGEKVITSSLDVAVSGMELSLSSEETVRLDEIIHE